MRHAEIRPEVRPRKMCLLVSPLHKSKSKTHRAVDRWKPTADRGANSVMQTLKRRQPEDWAWLTLLVSLGLYLLFSERFWTLFPF